MSTLNRPLPTLAQLEQAAAKQLMEKVLSKGGSMPSPQVFKAACRYLASKALREATKREQFDTEMGASTQNSSGLAPTQHRESEEP